MSISRTELSSAIPIMQAYLSGEEIEYKTKGSSSSPWHPIDNPEWSLSTFEYRVKPKPMVLYVNVDEYPANIRTAYLSKNDAECHINGNGRTVKFIEKI